MTASFYPTKSGEGMGGSLKWGSSSGELHHQSRAIHFLCNTSISLTAFFLSLFFCTCLLINNKDMIILSLHSLSLSICLFRSLSLSLLFFLLLSLSSLALFSLSVPYYNPEKYEESFWSGIWTPKREMKKNTKTGKRERERVGERRRERETRVETRDTWDYWLKT